MNQTEETVSEFQKPDAPPDDFRKVRLGSLEAAAALNELAREAVQAHDPTLAGVFLSLARRLSRPESVDALLASARSQGEELPSLSATLRFRAVNVAGSVLARLNDSPEAPERRVWFGLMLVLGGLSELRDALVACLTRSLDDSRWYVVRNAIMLLSMLGEEISRHRWPALAASPHRQVRLAAAQDAARWAPDRDALVILIPLLDDPDAGVRFAAAVALGAYPNAICKQALARRLTVEPDAEVRAACETGLRRKTEQARIA
jgi:HEAT repeat protein